MTAIPPLVRLAPGVGIESGGLRLGETVTPIGDVALVLALSGGVDVAEAIEDTSVHRVLDRLHRRRLLSWSVDGLAEAVPLEADVALPDPTHAVVDGEVTPGPLPLSRFALLRREGGGWVLESGRSQWQVRCTDMGVAALADAASAGERAPALLALLRLAGMLEAPDDDVAARTWAVHDRYFAARSRRDAVGWWAGDDVRTGEPEPASRQRVPDGPRVALPAPAGPAPDEPLLWEATEVRRTARSFGDGPVSLETLGALLWRTMRVVDRVPARAPDGTAYEGLLRPVPSGGAMHALDLWLVCGGVEGLAAGPWWYDPFDHALVGVAAPEGAVHAFLAGAAAAVSGPVSIAGILTAREARAAWKYGGIAYALQLKDVGVVMHAVQLTGGALGLGVCPIGSGPTRAVARLLGTDPEVDAPVGEFLVGRLP